MRIALALALALGLLSTTASAQTPMGDDVYVVFNSSLPANDMAAWQTGSMVRSAAGAGAE